MAFDLPEVYPVNGVTTPVAHILGQYYKAILLPFEEISRKQRPMLSQTGQPQQAGQHSMMPSQMPSGDMGAQGVIPPAIPHMDGGGSALPPQHPFSSSQTQRQQPSVGISGPSLQLQSPDMLSGVGSNISQPFLSQPSPDGSQLSLHGQSQDAPPLSFDADADGRKRKGAPEVDAKRVRQRTGMCPSLPITVRT